MILSASVPATGPAFATDLAGRRVPLLGKGNERAVVLLFVASDCPISNRYVPEIGRLEGEFAGRGVGFSVVYPNLTETTATIQSHQAAFGFGKEQGSRVLRDPQQELARWTGVKVTPEAAVLVPAADGHLRVVYAGRIDDRYLSIGNERPRATRHDLEEAIAAVLAGRAVSAPGGPAVGCGIVSVR